MPKSLFIVLDGLDGSGKSEMVKLVNDYFVSKGKEFNVLMTFEPSDGVFGKKIRKILKEEKDPKINAKTTFMHLFL